MRIEFSPLSFAAGLVVGAALGVVWFYAPAFTGMAGLLTSSSTPQPVASSSTPVGSESGALAVSNQAAGMTVTVDSVTVAPPGVWLAVRDESGMDLGNVLGAARVGGPRSEVSIQLLRATLPGHTYAVELYRDDGDGAFNLASDSVYVDFDSGQPVVGYFSTN